MKHIRRLTVIIALLLTLPFSGCASRQSAPVTKTVFAMDTVMTLTATGKIAQYAVSRAEEELFRLDALLTRHSDAGTVYRLNRDETIDNAELAAFAEKCRTISRETGGAFDITLAPLIDCWDLTGTGRVPSQEELAASLSRVGYERVDTAGSVITLAPGTDIDLGGAAKGYAGGRIREIYREYGVSGTVDLGGDACLIGTKTDGSLWRVGIRDPLDKDSVIGILALTDSFIVTSGSYERYFTADDGSIYHHILDPKTGRPAESGLLSVTVLHADGLSADALATAFFVMGADRTAAYLASHPDVRAVLVTESKEVLYSASLQGVFSSFSNSYTYETIQA